MTHVDAHPEHQDRAPAAGKDADSPRSSGGRRRLSGGRASRGRRGPAGRTSPESRVLVLMLVLALVGLAAVTGYYWDRGNDRERREAREAAAVSAARQAMVNLFKVDEGSADADVRRILDASTGEFKEEFSSGQATYLQVRQRVVQARMTAIGEVLEAGLVAADSDSATVLLAVDQIMRSTAPETSREGQLKHYRLRAEMAFEGGRWRVAKLDFVTLV